MCLSAASEKRQWLGPLIAIAAVIAVATWLGCVAIQIHRYSLVSECGPADAAIVLGAAVWDDAPSPVFEERIKHAINLHENGTVDFIIFTGGRGIGDRVAESEAARQYAFEQGVPDGSILIEMESHVTSGNLSGAQGLMKEHDLETALIVSDPLHMKRAMLMTRGLGIRASSCPTPTSRYQTWRTKSPFLLREVWFTTTYRLRHWGGGRSEG
jgi:uncharacterized SAM-binding protein YcdF (DUF218 family)